MALGDVLLKQLSKNKDKVGEPTTTSDKLKSKAALIISVFAAIFSVNAFIQGQLSSSILNNTIKANDTYSFYQAKSMKQTMEEYARDDAQFRGDKKRVEELTAKIDRYENEPKDGKKDLLIKAHKLEAERDEAKQRSPWIGYASTAYQLSIVLLSASILAVSMTLFWGSFVVAGVGILLSSQGVWLLF